MRNQYFKHLLNPNSESGHKRLWTFIKSKRQDNIGIASLEVNSTTYTDDLDKANILNNYFSTVFTTEDTSNLPSMEDSTYPAIDSLNITVVGVSNLLHDLEVHKACGPDGISPRLLKETASDIAPMLTLIYQATLKQQRVPADWKKALVVPIFKKGVHTCPANYRPISLTCIPCKIFEHIIYSHIFKHLNTHNILSQEQHGFRKYHSCESQLITTIDDFASHVDSGAQIDTIILDFSKAFDKVPHQRLLMKLAHYGIQGILLDWVKDFLSNRSQIVILNNASSEPTEVLSGVPQGSVLDPLLFLLYINDLPRQGRTQNLMWVGSFQEKVDLFDGAGVQSTLKLGGSGGMPPQENLKNRYQNTGFGDISATKALLTVGQKYVYSLHIIATPCI